MIIKTSKFRKDLLEEINIFSDVVKISRTYSTKDEKMNELDMLNFCTNYQEDTFNSLYINEFDKITILNDDGKKIYTFIPNK